MTNTNEHQLGFLDRARHRHRTGDKQQLVVLIVVFGVAVNVLSYALLPDPWDGRVGMFATLAFGGFFGYLAAHRRGE